MRFRYRPYRVVLYNSGPKKKIYRPVARVLLHGLRGSVNLNALFDTGADQTIFPMHYAQVAGVALDRDRPGTVHGVGGSPITVYPGKVELELTDGKSSYRWSAEVGFAPGNNALIGHIGALEFFVARFDHEARSFELVANNSFPSVPVMLE